MKKKNLIILGVLVLVTFLAWRFVRPMNIFIVDDRFAWPVDTTDAPTLLNDNLSAAECGSCHPAFYAEWQTTIHSQAWTDPYFQTDWKFDDSQHVCRLCHTPLDRQQPRKVQGYRDKDKWDPILGDNPDFDPVLQHEGVTCAACHLRDGKIVGVQGLVNAPHPVKKIEDPNQVCVRCHVVEGERWDTFFRFPPCGTVAEIKSSQGEVPTPGERLQLNRLISFEEQVPLDKMTTGQIIGRSGEVRVEKSSELGCVQCHMPLVRRPLVEGGEMHDTRRHLWRGGHDPTMVKSALRAGLVEESTDSPDRRRVTFTIVNTGAAHYLPTGTPDRHLSVQLRLLDSHGEVVEQEEHLIKRTILWRPFIIDLWDTRLPRWQPHSYHLEVNRNSKAVAVEVVVRYHLLAESRRKRIGYENTQPIAYEVFRQRRALQPPSTQQETE
ncbi:MAG: cytochrome c family protein [Proteobacteria bacterium]|jgi:hypothetical protein|nr:cytochrome c family protein [Pseudomonadota bacterium]